MKQIFGDQKCVACVGAVATGTTVKEFEDFTEGGPPYSDVDLYKYLLHKGYVLGGGFSNLSAAKINESTMLKSEYQMRNNPCYLIVKSETQTELLHAMYWDGRKVHDPNPKTKDGRSLESYEIKHVFQISKYG